MWEKKFEWVERSFMYLLISLIQVDLLWYNHPRYFSSISTWPLNIMGLATITDSTHIFNCHRFESLFQLAGTILICHCKVKSNNFTNNKLLLKDEIKGWLLAGGGWTVGTLAAFSDPGSAGSSASINITIPHRISRAENAPVSNRCIVE